MSSIKSAIEFSEEYHNGRLGMTGEPYFHHCMRVLAILQSVVEEESVLMAAVILSVEGTPKSKPDLTELFNAEVEEMVISLSPYYLGDKSIGSPTSQYNTFMYQKRLAKACQENPGALFIKIAMQIDLLSNFSKLPSSQKNQKVARIMDYFLPLYEKVSETLSPENQEKFKKLRKQLGDLVEKCLPELNT